MESKYNNPMTGLGEKERHLLTALLQQGKQTVRASDLVEQAGVSKKLANLILSRLSRKGWLQRLLPGIYGFVPLSSDSSLPVSEDPLALAMELFSPGYVTGWSAAEHWDLTEQVFNSISLASSRYFRTKTIEAGTVRYYIRHIAEDKIFGTQKIWRTSAPILIADPHRTIIDILESPDLGAGGRHALEIVRSYWRSNLANPAMLLDYAERIGTGTIFKRLGYAAEKFGKPDATWIHRCKSKVTKGISKLDPAGPNSGPILTRWKLRINVPVEESP